MLSKTKLIIGVALAAAIIIAVILVIAGSKQTAYEQAEVKRGSISQKVSASGQVVPAQKIELQFEIQGRIRKIDVVAGEQVKAGDRLAVLEDSELSTQVAGARSAVDVAKAELEKLLAGTSQEEIAVYETALENAQITLKNAQRDLADVTAEAQNNLQEAYDDGLDAINTAYTTGDKALKNYSILRERYFYFTDAVSSQVRSSETLAQAALISAKTVINKANTNSLPDDITAALSALKTALNQMRDALSAMRTAMEDAAYRTAVSSADRTTVNTERDNIDSAITDITTGQQAIASQKITNQININTSQSAVDTADNAVKTARDKLAQIKAPAREADINLKQAQLEQAEASLEKARRQLAKTALRAPIDGLVSDVKQEIGQTVSSQDTVVSMMTSDGFQIEVVISEVDIGKVLNGLPVEVLLDAFPEEKFAGKLIELDPAETVAQGVVYYKATIGFDRADERIKPGMTAEANIITETRENVLLIPSLALSRQNGQVLVEMLEDGKIKEVKVETGLRSDEGEVEILSGLKEGDKVITFTKKND